jgi:hypothetical protein
MARGYYQASGTSRSNLSPADRVKAIDEAKTAVANADRNFEWNGSGKKGRQALIEAEDKLEKLMAERSPSALPTKMDKRSAERLHSNAISAFDEAFRKSDEEGKGVKFKAAPSIVTFGEKHTGGSGFSDGIDTAKMDVVFHNKGFYYNLPIQGKGTAVMVPIQIEIKDGFKRAITREKDLVAAGKHLNIDWKDLDDVVRQNANQWFNRKG